MIELFFALSVEVPSACPRIARRPVAAYAEVPELIRRFEGEMADPGQAWNSSDVIRRDDPRPLRRMIAAGDMGQGRWLIVHESGGRGVIRHVDVWRIEPDGRLSHPVSESSGSLDLACEKAAARLAG